MKKKSIRNLMVSIVSRNEGLTYFEILHSMVKEDKSLKNKKLWRQMGKLLKSCRILRVRSQLDGEFRYYTKKASLVGIDVARGKQA